jgi:amino acid transporter
MHENRETSETPAGHSSRTAGKGSGRKTHMNVAEESDSGIVPMNHSNKIEHVSHAQSAAPHGANHYGTITTALLVAMWNYMGWDNASTVAQEVENPRRNYPLAMLATCGIVALSYILPLSAIAAAGIPVDQFTTGSWTDAARLLAGPWLAVAVVIGGIINGVGMFNALTLSYTRLPVVMAEDRMMPSALARRNRRRSPWVAILLCGLGWA